LSVIRVSGSSSFDIAERIISSTKKPEECEPKRMYRAILHSFDGNDIDDIMFAVFRSPKSYTGEDTVEIYTHGSPVIAKLALDALTAHGARIAEAGEFTLRSYRNGKIDLISAEIIDTLTRADNPSLLKAVRKTNNSGFLKSIAEISEDISGIYISLLASLEFPDYSESL
jgi:tRNA modification GTPase